MLTVPTGSFRFDNLTNSFNLTEALTAHWRLDESLGNRFDATGRGNTLTSNNNVASAVGKINSSSQFVSSNSQFLSKTNTPDVNLSGGDFTIACWVSLTSNVSAVFAGVYNTTNARRSYALNYNVGALNQFTFIASSDGSALTTVSASGFAVPLNTFVFLTGRHYRGNKIIITVNGDLHFEVPHTTGIFNSPEPFLVGSRNAGNNDVYTNGCVDSLSIWKRALTNSEILALYNKGNGLDFPFS